MNKSFPEILKEFPYTRFVSDKDITPFLFYEKYLPHSKKVWLKFGYFSTNAIRTLSLSFARFIFKGGYATIITNHFYNKNDAEQLLDDMIVDHDIINDNMNSADGIKNLLESEKQHFYNCLRYLLEKGRLKIQPVIKKDGNISHFKEGVFEDYEGNYIGFNGSCNFTHNGLMANGESLDFKAAWEHARNKKEIEDKILEIDSISLGNDSDYNLLKKEQLEIVIKKSGQRKELQELLEFEHSLIKKVNKSPVTDKLYKEILIEYRKEKNQPNFPFDKPRRYQEDAYESWLKNGYKGLFAMATGTGKTITSLNCVLNEFNITSKYNVIITVPTRSLLFQWIEEVKSFNFSNIITSSDAKYKDTLRRNLVSDNDFIFITTYATISRGSLDAIFLEFKDEFKDFIFISDECHNIGSNKLFSKIPKIFKKRIGLSATPERKYDENGSANLYSYFNSFPPLFTYNYSMKKAIDNGVLSEFNYYPRFTTLEEDELQEYIKITKKISRFLSNNDNDNPDWVNMELIKRKRIIDKAKRKKGLLKEIIEGIINDNSKPDFNYAFIYVPEGFEKNFDSLSEDDDLGDLNSEDVRVINEYCLIVGDELNLKVQKFTGASRSKNDVLEQFRNGKFDALLAMKCLDEGVDIPRTQYGIFCASTGNPRQYIQRRGRVLRTHENKELSYIYDMIVIPDLNRLSTIYDKELLSAEINIFKKEILRSINFIALSNNLTEILSGEFYDLCKEYEIDLSSEIKKELDNYNQLN